VVEITGIVRCSLSGYWVLSANGSGDTAAQQRISIVPQ
jgi:hypothetical protein